MTLNRTTASREQWLTTREALLAEEKELTRACDRVSRGRELPRVRDMVPRGRDEGGFAYTMEWLHLHEQYND